MDIIRGEDKVTSFMDKINQKKQAVDDFDSLSNSVDGKLRRIEREKEIARKACVDDLLNRCYKQSLPLGDEYKRMEDEPLSNDFSTYIMNRKSPVGVLYYVKEAIRKGSPFAKRMMEKVDQLVDDEYRDKEINVDTVAPEDLVFKMTDEIHKKIDNIGDDLSLEEISDKIKDNVKNTAIAEINRAKQEKQDLKKLEEEMMADPALNTQTAVESALELYNIKNERSSFYEPESVFMAMLVGKTNKLMKEAANNELFEEPLYDALTYIKESKIDVNRLIDAQTRVLDRISNKIDKYIEKHGESDPELDKEYDKEQDRMEKLCKMRRDGVTEVDTNDLKTESTNFLSDKAFLEAVKEYTCLNMLHTLGLEKFNARDLSAMKMEYVKG